MRLTYALLVLVAGLAISCGSQYGPGGDPRTEPPAPIPITRSLARAASATFDAGSNYGFAFSLPTSAAVTISANQTGTDTWNVAVFTPQQWADYQSGTVNQAYGGVHNSVMQVSDRVQLPSGDWYLGFHCDNVFQRCALVFNIEATY